MPWICEGLEIRSLALALPAFVTVIVLGAAPPGARDRTRPAG